MAIDLASSLSPYEFEKMLPLDVLAAVASETLRNEIHSTDSPEININQNSKKHVKKSANVMTFEDIKSLPIKSLIDKFSEMTSDELTKKYSYKCLLLPHKCAVTFKSFGNEKKACDKMKSHLLSHLQQLTSEYEANDDISNIVFIPKSPKSCGKHDGKIYKKSLKKHQIMFSQVIPQTNNHKSPKKSKASAFCLKKMKKFHKIDRNSVAHIKKCFKNKTNKMFNSIYLREKQFLKNSAKQNFKCISEDTNLSMSLNADISSDFDVNHDKKRYNNYSKHLSCVFLPDIKDEDDESLGSYDQISHGNDSSENETNLMKVSSYDKSLSFLQDHNYVITDETKPDRLFSQEIKTLSRKNIACFSLRPTIKPQLIIRTPPFPFVHTPLLPEVAEIKEIGIEEYSQSNKYEYLNFSDLGDDTKVKSELEEADDEQEFDLEDKYADTLFHKLSNTNGSVLECVENIVNIKHSNGCLPKSEMSASENDENLENMQRFEKELALEYIAKLHAKKRKRIPDSLICQICPDKHFTAQATLIHHYRSHAGIKPYACNICSATFTRQHSLNYHMLIHQNLSRFTCEFCGRTFRHPSHYKEHLRRHTGETPYHCTDCNLHFKTRNTFKRHLKTRHGKLLTASGIEDLTVEEYAKYCPKTKLGKQ